MRPQHESYPACQFKTKLGHYHGPISQGVRLLCLQNKSGHDYSARPSTWPTSYGPRLDWVLTRWPAQVLAGFLFACGATSRIGFGPWEKSRSSDSCLQRKCGRHFLATPRCLRGFKTLRGCCGKNVTREGITACTSASVASGLKYEHEQILERAAAHGCCLR